MEVDRNGLEVLDRSACLALLRGATIGRLGLTSGALPTVLPVNYRLVDDVVMFRTGVGTKLQAATSNAVVAFEVDEIDPVWHTGWSVVVTGLAREARPGELTPVQRAEADQVARWAPAGESRLVAVSTEMVSGRCIHPTATGPGAALAFET